jgi:stage II sporulation protein AA (anti-sigma F factor antagonist)
MYIDNKTVNRTLYIGLIGELDEHASEYTRGALDKILASSAPQRVVLDMSELSFMDSTGIGVLIGRFKKLQSRRIPVFISNPAGHVDKLFRMTGIYDIMPKI